MRFPQLMFASIAVLPYISTPCPGQAVPRQMESTLPALSRSFEQMVARVSPAVVQVLARGLTESSSGSGVVVDTGGYIVTNAHVVGLSRRIQVLIPAPQEGRGQGRSVVKPAGKLAPARVVGLDRETDIAVLKIEEQTLQALPFGDSEQLRQGQLVFAFGSPFGLDNSVTMGIVSSAARQVQPDGPMIYVQTDAPINPGNSGGALVDSAGELIGINTFIVSPSGSNSGVGFAAPGNIVHSVYEQIRKNGVVRRGQAGMKVQTITPALATALQLKQASGVIVSDVEPSSAAEAGGLEIKDILLTLDGKTLENARQFDVNIYDKAGQTVTVELLRGDEKLSKRVAVLERPADKEQLLSKLEGVLVRSLGVLAVDLDEKITPLLPSPRRLAGVVVVGIAAPAGGFGESLAAGDVIYMVNDAKVSNVKELEAVLGSMKAGESVALQVERAGDLQYAVVELQ